VAGHLLRDFQPAAILQIIRDAGCPETVAADVGGNAGRPRPAPDHFVDIRLVQTLALQFFFAPGAKERSAAIGADAGRLQILLQIFFEVVVTGDLVHLAAFFVQPQPAAPFLDVITAQCELNLLDSLWGLSSYARPRATVLSRP
jgi:hypothetical protein